MKCRGINFATAQIKGLTKPPYYFKYGSCYAWGITFFNTSTLFFNNIPIIKVGDTEEEGKAFCDQLKANFKKAHINEGNDVSIIYENDGHVVAIGKKDRKKGEDLWIDCTDKFTCKSLEELNLVLTA